MEVDTLGCCWLTGIGASEYALIEGELVGREDGWWVGAEVDGTDIRGVVGNGQWDKVMIPALVTIRIL